MTPEQITFYQEVARMHEATKYGMQSKYLQSVADTLAVSIDLIYENLKKVGYDSKRKTRTDKGDTHIDLKDARLVCNQIHQSRRMNNKRQESCDDAIEEAFSSGLIKQLYNSATLFRVAREHGFHPEQLARPTPHIQVQSLHPNHVWQVDASIGTLYYMPKGGIEFLDEKKHYKNKPENLEKVRNHLCIRYAVVDHYSGAFYVKYYATSGENQMVFFDVLANAFVQRPRESFYGIPQMLVMDKGAANTSHLVLNFLDKLGIQHYTHIAGNPRAKGSAEKIQDIIECSFEHRLKKLETPVRDADHLNELACEWRIFHNDAKIHTRTQRTRYAVWQTIKEDELIISPDMEVLTSILSSKAEERKVRGDLTITFKGRGFEERKVYRVDHIPLIKVGDSVKVTINPFRSPNIDIEMVDYKGESTLYECSPVEITEGGFYADSPKFGEEIRSPVDTITDTHRKEMLKEAYGVETLEEAEKLKSKNAQLFNGKIDPMKPIRDHLEATSNVEAMPKRGTALDLKLSTQVLENVPVAELCALIKTKLGDRYPEDTYMVLSKKYPDGADPLEANNIASWLITRSQLQVVNN